MLKAIHAQEDKAAARQKAALVSERLRAMKLERIASFVENSVEETLSYMDFPYEHWRRLRTNNGLERIMKCPHISTPNKNAPFLYYSNIVPAHSY